MIYNSILETMGNTPLVRLNKVTRGIEAQIVAKVEFFNPGGSVKDRIGIQIIEDAEKDGLLKPGGTIVESTSGNTGVGLAIAAALRGYKTIFVLPDKMSQEKIQLLRAFGARVVITPTNVEPDDPRSYYSVARKIAQETPNAILANQYHNPSNPKTHELTTGPEIWEQTNGKIDVFVCGVGTGGTVSGVSRYLKSQNPNIQIVGVDPIGSLLHGHFKTGNLGQAHGYKIEGIGEDFLPSTYDYTALDEMIQVMDKESFLMTRQLVRDEGLFVGISSGSAVVGALKYARENQLGPDKLVVVLLPDTGARYLSKVFNDDWMRENQLLDPAWIGASVETLLDRRRPHELITAHSAETVKSVIEKMRKYDISQLPVLNDKRELLGLVEEVNLLHFMLSSGAEHADTKLAEADLITPDTVTVSTATPLETLMGVFATNSVAIVKDNGDIRDIVTKIDLIDFLAHAG